VRGRSGNKGRKCGRLRRVGGGGGRWGGRVGKMKTSISERRVGGIGNKGGVEDRETNGTGEEAR